MRTSVAILCSVAALSGFFEAATAREALLLVPEDEHLAVVKTTPNGLQDMLTLEGLNVVYGESRRAFAFLSQKSDGWQLDLLEKGTQAITSRAVAIDDVLMELSGPAKDMMLNDNAAYFVTFGSAGFRFNQLSLADGSVRAFSLPNDVSNPRVVDSGGIPLIVEWEGYRVWKFDPAAASLQLLVTADDVDETTRRIEPRVRAPGFYASFVMVHGVGVFRLSRLGGLQQVLNADLTRIAGPPVTLQKVGRAGHVPRVFSGVYRGTAAIGVVREWNGRKGVTYMDPLGSIIRRQAPLTAGAVLDSIFPTPDDSILYVDSETAAVNDIDLGTFAVTPLWKVPADGANLARILSVTPP